MTAYIILGFLPYFASIVTVLRRNFSLVNYSFLLLFYMVLILFVGLRFEVGTDWNQYIVIFNLINEGSFIDGLLITDPGYGFLNIITFEAGLGIYAVNLICAAILVLGIAKLSIITPYPWLVVAAALPHLVTVMAMDHIRQATALGFVLLAMAYLFRGETVRFFIFLLFAVLFHRTSVVILCLAIVSVSRNKYATAGIVTLLFGVIGLEIWGNRLEVYHSRYIETERDSRGAIIRVILTAFPSVMFLIFMNRLSLPEKFRQFMIFMALGSIVCVFLLSVSPSTVIVDRMAKYFIPVQMIAFPFIIYIIRGYMFRFLISFLLISYFAAAQFFWLRNSPLAQDFWIPYKTVIF